MGQHFENYLLRRSHKPLCFFLGICVTACFLVSCNSGGGGGGGGRGTVLPVAQDSSGDPDNYYPSLTVGNTWMFRGVVTTNGTGTTYYSNKITITGTRAVQDVMTSIWHESNSFNYGEATDDYISKDPTGITYWGNSDSTDPLMPHLIPYKEVSFPLQVGTFEQLNKTGLDYGEDLDGDGVNETFDVYSRVSVISFQTLTVSVGTFDSTAQIVSDSTITVHFSLDSSELVFRDKETDWYAPRAGLIKREDVYTDYDGTIETTSEEIVGYDVEGQKKGIVKEFAVAPGQANEPSSAPLGFDGTNYLYVACRDVGSTPGLIGVTVSPQGETLSTFPIAQFTLGTGCSAPSLAFDGSNFFVAYPRAGLIYGTIIKPNGTVLVSSFAISTGIPYQITNYGPAVAFDGTNYMVVWEKFTGGQYDIYGARVKPGGTVIDEFVVFSAPGEQVFPSIAFDGTNYLVVWRDTRNGSGPSDSTDIYGTRVTPAAVVLDPTGIAISTASKCQGDPRVIFDGTNYFVVWSDQRLQLLSQTNMKNDVYGARVSKDGVLLDGPSDTGGIAINTASYNHTYFDVAFDGQNYFVVWGSSQYSISPPAGIFGARVSKDGALVYPSSLSDGIPLSGLPPYAVLYQHPSILFNGENMLLTYSGGANINGILIYP